MPKLNPVPSASASPYYMLEEAAEFLRLHPRTLDNMRGRGVGPIYRKHGGRIIYHQDDLVAWSKSSRRHSSSEKANDDPDHDSDISNGVDHRSDPPVTPGPRHQSDREHAARHLPAVAGARASQR